MEKEKHPKFSTVTSAGSAFFALTEEGVLWYHGGKTWERYFKQPPHGAWRLWVHISYDHVESFPAMRLCALDLEGTPSSVRSRSRRCSRTRLATPS
jgi:hypothetical protein